MLGQAFALLLEHHALSRTKFKFSTCKIGLTSAGRTSIRFNKATTTKSLADCHVLSLHRSAHQNRSQFRVCDTCLGSSISEQIWNLWQTQRVGLATEEPLPCHHSFASFNTEADFHAPLFWFDRVQFCQCFRSVTDGFQSPFGCWTSLTPRCHDWIP